MSQPELLPTRAVFEAGAPIPIEVRGLDQPATLSVYALGQPVRTAEYDGTGLVTLPSLPAGGYSVELISGQICLRTALDVSGVSSHMRYGFVASYAPDKDCEGVTDLVRRLHLTDVQFYDWAYRHADLVGGGEHYKDALNQPISLTTVRELIAMVNDVGARALGYAAVYAAGPDEWPRWQHQGLIDAAGTNYGLGDFLFILDPAAPDWLKHFTTDLFQAVQLGFDGFHLDQYGYPKTARRADGAAIDVARSFCEMIEKVRAELPDSHLVFNNVNDFPTRATAATSQDAIYIEVWEPQLCLEDLARTVERARSFDPVKPVVIAAYQNVFDSAPVLSAESATALTMATLFSHGATQLLAGEADRLLIDPYYVRNHIMEPSTQDLLKRWYDFLVAHQALLMPRDLVDVTNSYAGEYNGDLDVGFQGTAVSGHAKAGTVWRRVVQSSEGLVVHLINLVSQPDTLWDAARNATVHVKNGRINFRCVGPDAPNVFVADPDGEGRLVPLTVAMEGNIASAVLPDLGIWQVILIQSE